METDLLFWEQIPQQFYTKWSTDYLKANRLKINISRDKNFNLNITFNGNSEEIEFKNIFEGKKFPFVIKEKEFKNLLGYTIDSKWRLEINGFSNFQQKISSEFTKSKIKNNLTLFIDPNNIVLKKIKNISPIEFTNYFYINGPSDRMEFISPQEYKIAETISIDSENPINNYKGELNKKWKSYDCLNLEYKKKPFVVILIYEKEESKRKFIIQFSKKDIPTKNELFIIETILSFIIGRKIINIGYASYDQTFQVIEESFVNPRVKSLEYLLNTESKPSIPISFNAIEKYGEENTIKRINNLFVQLDIQNQKIPFKIIFNHLFYSWESVFFLKVHPLSTVLDMIIQAWIEKQLKKYSRIIPKAEFKPIKKQIECYLNELIKETNKNDIKKIIKKIQILNNKSIAEQQKDFLIFYNINLNKKEVEILQYRNKCIHGHIPEDENEIINTEGYISFINRIILKILKYEGDYLDYSFLDPKTKSIDVGIGEGLI
jgi:hypothetical protein